MHATTAALIKSVQLDECSQTNQPATRVSKVGRDFRSVSSSGNPVIPLLTFLHQLELQFLDTCDLNIATIIETTFRLRGLCDCMGMAYPLR